MKAVWNSVCITACFASASAAGLAQDVTYRKEVKILLEAKCVACHGADSPTLAEFLLDQKKYSAVMKGPRLDTYADLLMLVGWPDTGAIMRRLDDGKGAGAGGKPGNMYQYLGGSDEERQKNLQVFKAWVGPDGWTLKRWEARGNVPGISREELGKIRVKY